MNALATWSKARERIDALSLRERLLVLAALAALLFTAWQTLLMDPLEARRRQADSRLASLRDGGGDEADIAAHALTAALERERALRGRLEHLRGEIRKASGAVVPPSQMTAVLQEVLSRQRGLTLHSLRKLPPAPVIPAEGDAAPQPPFMQPLELVVDGDFASISAYLRDLESLPWGLYWRALDIDASGWPRNRARIEIGTLSASTAWMGP